MKLIIKLFLIRFSNIALDISHFSARGDGKCDIIMLGNDDNRRCSAAHAIEGSEYRRYSSVACHDAQYWLHHGRDDASIISGMPSYATCANS